MKTWALSLRSGLCPACRSQASSHISAYRMDLRRQRNALQNSRYIGSAARPTLFTPEGSRDSRLISRAATASCFDLARPGIALYGVLSSQNDRPAADVRLAPVLSLKSRIACIRELPAGESAGYGLAYTAQNTRRIAIVSAGYADGIPRSLSNRGHALVNGKRVPIIGRICMDQLTLDVTDVPDARRGDEVVFIGRSGDSMIRAEEMAEDAGTITNEILSRMGKRVQRIVI